jgi:subtilisin-like proprotein convertase family protein
MTGSALRFRARAPRGHMFSLALLGALIVLVTSASGVTFSNTNVVTINDGVAATAYPTTIAVAGLTGTVTNVTVTFTGFSHAKSSDVDMLLIAPFGAQATIMSDAGGAAAAVGVDFTLDDSGATTIPAPLVNGTYKPTNLGSDLDAWPSPAPLVSGFPTTPAPFSAFNGGNPNGTWSLYIVDDTTTGTGTIAGGWTLTVTTSLDPATAFSNAAAITINDRTTSPLAATPYPSPITVSGLPGTIAHMSVTLNQFRHTFPDDVDVLLAGPAGQNAIVMSDVGGSANVDSATLTLDDSAAGPLPDGTVLSTGTFQPTNFEADVFAAGAPVPLGGSALSVFTGTVPNGTWNLWVSDDASIDAGYLIGGWSLDISAPTAVGVASLSAARQRGGVLVNWRTASEVQTAGFDLYRGATKLNRSLIAAKHAGQARGAAYRFLDRGASRTSATYRLVVVRLDGTRAPAGWTALRSSQ